MISLIRKILLSLVVVAAAACGGSSDQPPAQPTQPGPTEPADPEASTPPSPAPAPASDPSDWKPPTLPTSSAACGTPRDDAAGVDYTTSTGRTFHVWGPTGYDASKPYPVVIMFHGWYADGRAFESWFQMEQYVDNSAFVVYPDANNQLWDLDGTSDLEFFDAMVKQLGETYCIDPSRVLGFGFSYGGKFANHLGCNRAGYVKAISVGDGSWGTDGDKCGRLPVLFTHRTHDTDELIDWGRAAATKWTGLDGCNSDTSTDDTMDCLTHTSCKNPGGTVTFCEDTWFDPSWPTDWNHTVREPYRAYTWQWFAALK